MSIQSVLGTALVGAVAVASARGQYLMVCDTSFDGVVLVSDYDGSIVNGSFIANDTSGSLYSIMQPIEALQVDDEIWVVDQLSDQIIRFDLYGLWLGTIQGQLDNLRGAAYANGVVYVLNGGTANGAPGKALIVFDIDGTRLTSYPVGDCFDVIERNSQLILSNIGNDDLQRYSFSGQLLGTFHASDGVSGIDSPLQMQLLPNGNVLATGQLAPLGIFEYDSSGAQVQFYATGSGNRGVAALGNGKLLYTDGAGLRTYDPVTAVTATIQVPLICYYISPLHLPVPPVAYCTTSTSSIGCLASISATGTPSASATSGFTIRVDGVEGFRQGVIFYGLSGRAALPWANGSSSWLCVRMPNERTPPLFAGGTIGGCDGTLLVDWNAFTAANPFALGVPFSGGEIVDAQGWFRDPPAPRTTNLSNALEFTVSP